MVAHVSSILAQPYIWATATLVDEQPSRFAVVTEISSSASSARRRKSVFVCQRLRLRLTSLRPVFFARLVLTLAATRRRDLFLLAFAFAFARFNFEVVATARLPICRGV